MPFVDAEEIFKKPKDEKKDGEADREN